MAANMETNMTTMSGMTPEQEQGQTSRGLFEPMVLRGLRMRNRVWMPPMCMYSVDARDGKPTPFHYQHYVSRAMGGFGMVIAESTAVTPDGRISPEDLGLWNDDQMNAWRWIVDGVRSTGAAFGVQLNHAGRKASSYAPDRGHGPGTVPGDEGGWPIVGPSAVAFGGYALPRELGVEEIHGIVDRFREAAVCAVLVGFQMIQIHAAHGYLLSQFLDPLVNRRTDEYGGSLANRMRLLLEVVDAVRGVMPQDMPLTVRISATDWAKHGWGVEDSVDTANELRGHGVDLIDVSSGGIVDGVSIPVEPGYQVPFSRYIRHRTGMPVTAVGLITKPKQAERIIDEGRADAVEIGRAALRDPYWPLRAAHKLGVPRDSIPYQRPYLRGAWRD